MQTKKPFTPYDRDYPVPSFLCDRRPYETEQDYIDRIIEEAEEEAATSNVFYTHEEVFGHCRQIIDEAKRRFAIAK